MFVNLLWVYACERDPLGDLHRVQQIHWTIYIRMHMHAFSLSLALTRRDVCFMFRASGLNRRTHPRIPYTDLHTWNGMCEPHKHASTFSSERTGKGGHRRHSHTINTSKVCTRALAPLQSYATLYCAVGEPRESMLWGMCLCVWVRMHVAVCVCVCIGHMLPLNFIIWMKDGVHICLCIWNQSHIS